jgi:hypothetical protein
MPIGPRRLAVFSSFRLPKPNRLPLAILIAGILNLTSALAGTGDVTLTCDPNSEPDLEGYGIYFSRDVDGPPYDLYGYIAIQELSDPSRPIFTITGLERERRYFITLSAYDSRGNESDYALSVCAEVSESGRPCSELAAAVEDGDTPRTPAESGPVGGSRSASRDESGASGSSAGCFIRTAAGNSRLMGIVQLASLVGLAALIRWAWRWRSTP